MSDVNVDAAVERLREYVAFLTGPMYDARSVRSDVAAVLDDLAKAQAQVETRQERNEMLAARAESAEADVKHLRGVHDRMRIELDATDAERKFCHHRERVFENRAVIAEAKLARIAEEGRMSGLNEAADIAARMYAGTDGSALEKAWIGGCQATEATIRRRILNEKNGDKA